MLRHWSLTDLISVTYSVRIHAYVTLIWYSESIGMDKVQQAFKTSISRRLILKYRICFIFNFPVLWLMNEYFPDKSKQGKAIPVQACSGPGVSRSLRLPDFMTIGTEGVRLSALRFRRFYRPLPRKYSDTNFCWRLSGRHSAAGKIPMTLSAIEPATFWFIVQCLN